MRIPLQGGGERGLNGAQTASLCRTLRCHAVVLEVCVRKAFSHGNCYFYSCGWSSNISRSYIYMTVRSSLSCLNIFIKEMTGGNERACVHGM